MSFRKPQLPFICTLATCLMAFSLPGIAATATAWTLNSEASSFYYVTSKASTVSELNSFSRLDGGILSNGNASLAIFLDSVDTAVDIRNERMRDIVFQVENYQIATVKLNAEMTVLSSLDAGESVRATYNATIDLHGMQQVLPVDLLITGLEKGGLLVTLAKPLIINAASFGLADSVEQLREIAGLPSINHNVIVDFTLQFDPD